MLQVIENRGNGVFCVGLPEVGLSVAIEWDNLEKINKSNQISLREFSSDMD
jgi:hypothetical protein